MFANRPVYGYTHQFNPLITGKFEVFLSGKDGAMANEDADLQKIKEIIEIMQENELVEVEIKHGDDKIFLKRACSQQPALVPVVTHQIPTTLSAQGAPQAPAPQENLVDIKSPLVGTFYIKPSPDSDPYVEVGSQITPQTVICIIEAMKVMNEIKAENSGTVVEVLVKNGEAVEYGQVLFKVRPG